MTDLIEATGMQEQLFGVRRTESRCRDGTVAYDIMEAAILMTPTNTLFPTGLPQDFSILVVAKPKANESTFKGNNYLQLLFDAIITYLHQFFLKACIIMFNKVEAFL